MATDDPHKESDAALLRGCLTFVLVGASVLGLLLGFAATLEEEDPVGTPNSGHLGFGLLANGVTVLLAAGGVGASRKWSTRALPVLVLAAALYRTVHVWTLAH
ncbi:hypothetical protein ACIRPK_34180 [Kitasatospora sp. NPDC101801]|uniref:hypothetical protein n=1 Tax=Kitasatospora sp. NPDC101801 TaxID=3364103 RepID=UPI0037F772A6